MVLTPRMRNLLTQTLLSLGKFTFRASFSFCLCTFITSQNAYCQTEDLAESFSRLEETLRTKIEDESFNKAELGIILVAQAEAYYESSKTQFQNSALAVLNNVFGAGQVRMCTACTRPEVETTSGNLEMRIGERNFTELRALDNRIRGTGTAAKSALWIEEISQGGFSIRLVSLLDGSVLYADLITPEMEWSARTRKNFDAARDLQRRARGESLTHAFIDVGIYPIPHIALDWMEQWGTTNANLTGLAFSFVTPLIGLGPTYARAFPNLMGCLFGAKALLSIPTALVQNISQGRSGDFVDPILTVISYARMPIPLGAGNYSIFVFMALPQAKFGIGISANNTSLLPIVP